MIEDALEGVLFPIILTLVSSFSAYRLGFFKRIELTRPPIFLPQLLSVLGIYLGYFFVLATFLQILLMKIASPKPVSSATFMNLQFFIVVSLFLTLILYLRTEGKVAFKAALKNPESTSSRLYDFGLGMSVYLVAYPLTLVINRLSDLFLSIFFHFENYEQTAIRYLKENLESPFHLAMALFLIVIIAPIIEEILFRGTLQQYLKRFFSTRVSITITAVIFACFHFSASQQLGNLTIISSLFVFACFLGYTYERQGSIYASIGLHSMFNLASSLQILLGS
jgi:membrane protease YdiL (CAAX protease family)